MNANLPFNWFDVFLLVWLAMGIFRGRKRGMSQELLTFLQWIAIVVVCGFLYKPIGDWISQFAKISHLLGYILGYLLVAGGVALVFLGFKRSLHGKLVGSDAFGKSEYYLGMPSGMLRFICMLIFVLALLNARLYSQQEVAAALKFQQENYGSEFFPEFHAVQASVFKNSFTGPFIQKYLGFLLITPTAPEATPQFKQKDWQG
jgi:uncharacterized membrane protein required for colicin V production